MWVLYDRLVATVINVILGIFLLIFIHNGRDIYDKLHDIYNPLTNVNLNAILYRVFPVAQASGTGTKKGSMKETLQNIDKIIDDKRNSLPSIITKINKIISNDNKPVFTLNDQPNLSLTFNSDSMTGLTALNEKAKQGVQDEYEKRVNELIEEGVMLNSELAKKLKKATNPAEEKPAEKKPA